jgi:putative lipoic acid-binding regulatory protein
MMGPSSTLAVRFEGSGMDRDAALDLLRRHHSFPGPFVFRVVVRPADAGTVVAAMVAGAGFAATVEDVEERRSRQGTYVALRVRIFLDDAERVLDVYEVLRVMKEVRASL